MTSVTVAGDAALLLETGTGAGLVAGAGTGTGALSGSHSAFIVAL